MTTIKNLPEEVITVILNQLESKDVYQCQFICSAWYFPAHLKCLKKIKLTNVDAIKQFIEAIDQNPNPTYLKAVKHIQIVQPRPEIQVRARRATFAPKRRKQYGAPSQKESTPSQKASTPPPKKRISTFDEETIRKMLHRFPNLEKVEVTNSTMFAYALNDELCTEVLKCCPKLDTFEVNWNSSSCSQGTYKAQLLLTKLNLAEVYLPPNVAEYISRFPRLQSIVDGSGNVARLLPALEQSDSLRELDITLDDDDKEDFAEEYLKTKSQEEQNQLVKRFSNIKRVQLSNEWGFFFNSLNFVAKYMTGLDALRIKCVLKKKANNPQQTAFLNLALGIANTVNSCDLDISFALGAFVVNFSMITRNLFSKPGNNSLTFRMVSSQDEVFTADMIFKSKDGKRNEITCTITSYYWLHQTAQQMTSGDNVDEFRLCFVNHNIVNVGSYEKILEKVSPLKTVVLEIPTRLNDSGAPSGRVHVPTEQVTFLATTDGPFQSLLNMCSAVFPNMKHLSLYYSSGIWHQSIRDFRIEIAQCTLERLTVDATPVRKMMEQCPNFKFFVIEVEFWENCKRQAYRVSFDLDTVARVYDGDLDSYKRGQDYIRILIIVTGLQYLELCMHRNTDEDSPSENDYFDKLQNIIRRTIELEQATYCK